LARQVERAEGLRSLYEDSEFRAVHLAMLPPGRARKRGEISADWALAEAKLEEAHSIDVAMDWLKPAERMIVMLDPELIALLAAIPKSPIVPIDTAA
jgi:membrane glycosyltransferase